MDNFIDKLAQKFNAQELIKANSHAEEQEMKRLQLQVEEYERILQEIRKLNYKNTEISERLSAMVGENADKLGSMKEEEQKLLLRLRDITDEQTRNREAELEQKEAQRAGEEKGAQDQMAALREFLDEKFKNSDDFAHKENVKVYRNVQAVVIDELKKHAEGAKAGNEEIGNAMSTLENNIEKKISRKLNAVMAVCILSLLASVTGAVLYIFQLLMIWGVIK